MLTHPQFDPIAIHFGPIDFHLGSLHVYLEGVHWYGLMYLLGFTLFLLLGRRRLRTLDRPGWDNRMLDDLLFYGVLGVILGARLGDVFFYNPGGIGRTPRKSSRFGKAACPSTAGLSAYWSQWPCLPANTRFPGCR